MKGSHALALVIGLAGLVSSCSERLAAPAPCAEPCLPAPEIRQITLSPLNGADSSFAGYIARDHEITMLISNGLTAGDDRGYVRFLPRGNVFVFGVDSTRDSLSFVVDSVAFRFNLVARDTLVLGDTLYLYQIDASVDTTVEFPALEAAVTNPAKLLMGIPIPDSMHSGILTGVMRGADLDRIQLSAADTAKLAIAIRLAAQAPTGVILSSSRAGTSPTFASFVTVDTADTTVQHQVISRTGFFSGTRSATTVVPNDAFLTLGGSPSSRAILRFQLPASVTDTGTVLKAELRLFPTAPIYGLPNVNAHIEARNALTDLGRKSPTSSISVQSDSLIYGTTDTVRLPVTTLVRNWGGTVDLPHILVVALNEEGGSFVQPIFGSTRTPGPDLSPKLVVTYSLPYVFSRP